MPQTTSSDKKASAKKGSAKKVSGTKASTSAASKRSKPAAVRGSAVATPTAQLAKDQSRFFEVRKSGIQGRGAFASQKIRKGQRVIEYTGEHISAKEADVRYDESSMKRHHTFLFTLSARTVIDGAMNGNESIYINHSCDPNCEAVITDGHIYIHALRTIEPDEELGYDYQYERTGESDDELEKFYKCLCGAANCRGSIMKPVPEPRGNKSGKRRVQR